MSSTSAEARAFVDTNVLVYAYDAASGEKHRRARALLEELLDSRRGCVSVQVLQELYVTLTRRVSSPLDSRTAGAVVGAFATWTTHAPAAEDVLAAIELHERAQISFWDAMIVRSASALDCEVLFTEDLNAGQQYDGVLVVDPFAG
jgi:predicted nucleic acid-binding protein